MKLDKYMVVGRSVLYNHGMSDAMVAEMFEAVSSMSSTYTMYLFLQRKAINENIDAAHISQPICSTCMEAPYKFAESPELSAGTWSSVC